MHAGGIYTEKEFKVRFCHYLLYAVLFLHAIACHEILFIILYRQSATPAWRIMLFVFHAISLLKKVGKKELRIGTNHTIP